MIDGYFLEAIALEECLISNCLFSHLQNTGAKLNSPSFYLLLKSMPQHSVDSFLIERINHWHDARNTAIHGFIFSRSEGFSQSREDFHRLSKATAEEGATYCKEIVSWYEVECVNFIKHQFSTQRRLH